MKRILYIICSVLLLASCTKEDRNLMLVNQEEAIDRYISAQKNVRIARNGGSNRLVATEGRGADSLEVGDAVNFYYAGYIFSNGKGSLFATNNPEVAQKSDFPLSGGVESAVIGEGSLITGLDKGLAGARAGEVCQIVFSAKYGYDNESVYNVPKMSPLIFDVWVESIVKN